MCWARCMFQERCPQLGSRDYTQAFIFHLLAFILYEEYREISNLLIFVKRFLFGIICDTDIFMQFMFCRCWYLVADMMKKVLGREMSAGISPDRGNTRNYLTPILILMSNDTNQGFISRPSQHDQKIDILNFPYDQVSVRQTFLCYEGNFVKYFIQ